MTIGTSLQHTLATKQFTRLDTEISSLQSQISSGETDPRASVDPVRALNISASQDQKGLLEQFEKNLETADQRLSLSDSVLEEVGNILERFSEIAIRGASASVSDSERDALRIEAVQLRDNFVLLAQSRDDTGKALFGGYQTQGDPFVDDGSNVEYVGDTGRHTLRVSDNALLPTSLHGDELFMQVEVEGANGTETRDVFSIIEDTLSTLAKGGGSRQTGVTVADDLRFKPGGAAAEITMTIEGPSGRATITAPYMAGAPDALLAAVNAVSATTGISAIIDPSDPAALRLSGVGDITLSDLQMEGGGARQDKEVTITPMTSGTEGNLTMLVPEELSSNAQISAIGAAINHIADKRAEVGSIQQSGERQASALDSRMEMVERALAGYQGLDIAAAVTELQALLLNREAAQQTYAKISSQTLFDFLG
ncbi:Hook-filament junction protein [Thalassovita gelatinovora]|uniref:Hook-filament junction protein n=1 Tax=Thalassovita gelatinovora TaxID=53501 RepID=A0A0N7LWA4_THAGE|nr:flagellar hook-associated protein FlgL [Thalassovita gelatinovora]QIZ78999.1 flagellar hook-associated protein FlgL [Thalassovita gelatinovora]CUH68546.1 Hook-filament junction protein [Thalassovita gelatinovora]SEQ54385.1 flagellar hook-associated protein 3 FlgL [Thalassovita gelatinovora]